MLNNLVLETERSFVHKFLPTEKDTDKGKSQGDASTSEHVGRHGGSHGLLISLGRFKGERRLLFMLRWKMVLLFHQLRGSCRWRPGLSWVPHNGPSSFL